MFGNSIADQFGQSLNWLNGSVLSFFLLASSPSCSQSSPASSRAPGGDRIAVDIATSRERHAAPEVWFVDSGRLPLRAAPAPADLLVQRQQPARLPAQRLHDRRLRAVRLQPRAEGVARHERQGGGALEPRRRHPRDARLHRARPARLLRPRGRLGPSPQPARRPVHRLGDRAPGLLQRGEPAPRDQVDRDGPHRRLDPLRDPHPRPAARADRRAPRGGRSRPRRRRLADVPLDHLPPAPAGARVRLPRRLRPRPSTRS